jgi:mono/diheme cytochrome c family protein
MRKVAIGVGVLILLVGGSTALVLMFTGPRMRVQPRMLAYQARQPATPEGVVPVSAGREKVSLPQAESDAHNPLPDTEETLATGRVFYGYYCVFCHGQTGRGDGPVGYAYVPAPTDLTSSKVQALSDAQLYTAMLTGAGHDPVLPRVIDPNHRWYLVSFVRSLGSNR